MSMGTQSRYDIHVPARLAMIGLNDDEAKRLQAELDAIMVFLEPLERVDLPDVEPTIRPFSPGNAWREDVSEIKFTREEMIGNAPYQDGEYIKVPQVLADEGMMS
ncbi:MAG: Asp-tRNA(Asn)/Glu-tRNA(Gln) amidotransferase subunit GatC [Victivallaceae bacterium]|nr:Asp-tRNA(Asn)/Glu-tRNA(Gln) amidotransferase subunit GatC [Victivallaceae bacterium]MDD3117483.1 Asp-tRNA(Asn)/Glu-tRNA(Gln) amidotransferase subunit GatC [Victivallaceae bacterium]MDD4317365.1 Asp-tRNA(Asn)/Glu-tRNA(Gln) amidotransferase subunit GatC [Victivallaceae bacterium]MDD5663755.1 Asp-tRNA(Asn)/Glu-tRNA(Gln) amidotransferase subunit GatC [Victivallaceae bacterium]NLK83679.1 Asp-tRNA(Asn)/Glu-tRNA(Gln) amidotransferase subunit GatC [Lentisphaerota bacterium]